MKVDRGVFCVIVVIWRREMEGKGVSGENRWRII